MAYAREGAHEDALTARETEILKWIAEGKPNKAIAAALRISERTVKFHVSAILRALNVHTRTQVVIELARRGVRLEAPLPRLR